MSGHVSILRWKQRTRRERMLDRLHASTGGIGRRWERLRRRRRYRAAQRRAQELFLQLERRLRHAAVDPGAPAHRGRPHVRLHR